MAWALFAPLAAETRVDQAPPRFGVSDHQIAAIPGGADLMAWIQFPPLGGDTALIEVFSRRDLGGGILADPVRVNTTPSIANFSNLRVLARGSHVYAAWERTVQFSPPLTEVRFNHSGDGGATWEQDRVVTPQGVDAGGGFALAFGPLQDVYVAYSVTIAGQSHVLFARSRNHGTNWERPVHIDRSPAGSTRPAMAADTSGRVVVAWRDLRGGASIFANSSSDRGATFQTADARVAALEGLGIEVTSDGAGRFYTSFEDSATPVTIAVASSSADGGKTWNPPVRIDDNGAGIQPASLEFAVSGGGHVHATMVYKLAGGSGGLFYRGSDDDGATFRPAMRLDTAPEGTEAFFSALAAGPDGLVLCSWAQLMTGVSPGVILARTSRDFGQTFSATAVVSATSAVPRFFPEAALDAGGSSAAVAWQEGTAPAQKLFFNTLPLF